MLTKEHALTIADKLHAEIKHKSAHDIAVIRHKSKRVAQFGIRRGSRKNQSHDHIPNSIHLSPHRTLELAECTVSEEDWLETMKEKHLL